MQRPKALFEERQQLLLLMLMKNMISLSRYRGGEGRGLFGNNMPRARASLSQADLVAMRRQQRENYDMHTEDTRAQQRSAEAREAIREQRRILRGGWLGEDGMNYNYHAQAEAQRTLDTFRETGVNADRRATEREIAEANESGRRRREEVEQGRMVRARVEGSVMGAVRR